MKKIVKRIVNNYIELTKLKSADKAAKIGAKTTLALINFMLLMIGVLFLAVALAIFLSQVSNQPFLGFAAVGVLFLIAMLLLRLWTKSLYKRFVNFFIKTFFEE